MPVRKKRPQGVSFGSVVPCYRAFPAPLRGRGSCESATCHRGAWKWGL